MYLHERFYLCSAVTNHKEREGAARGWYCIGFSATTVRDAGIKSENKDLHINCTATDLLCSCDTLSLLRRFFVAAFTVLCTGTLLSGLRNL